MLKPDAFQAAFRQWLIEMDLLGGADVIAFDGKSKCDLNSFSPLLRAACRFRQSNSTRKSAALTELCSHLPEMIACSRLFRQMWAEFADVTCDWLPAV